MKVAHACTTTQAASQTTDTIPVESISVSSTAPSSSLSTPFHALVPLARVQKLEAEMATLLHHIQPWMQRSIAKAEEHLECKLVQHIEWKIIEVHQRLDAFELRVLDWPAPLVLETVHHTCSSRLMKKAVERFVKYRMTEAMTSHRDNDGPSRGLSTRTHFD